jgi:undecaprenyl-diphosphatase
MEPANARAERLHRSSSDLTTVALAGAGALIAFALIGRYVVSHETTSIDFAVQTWTLAHQRPSAHTLFLWITGLGGITAMRVVAILGAVWLAIRGHRLVAAEMLIVPIVADLLFHVAKRFYARPRPLGLGAGMDSSYAFPSGHATVSAAVCVTLAFVLLREGLIGRPVALAIAVLVPILVGVSRVYLNVHWVTDVVGGWCAGVIIASVFVAPYAYLRQRRVAEGVQPA